MRVCACECCAARARARLVLVHEAVQGRRRDGAEGVRARLLDARRAREPQRGGERRPRRHGADEHEIRRRHGREDGDEQREHAHALARARDAWRQACPR
jgi:hypothetical protein